MAGETKAKAEAARGAWVVVDDAGVVQVVESGELKAFRAAAPLKGSVRFWPFGKSRDDVLTGGAS
jgi:hypothetical protein